MRLGVTDLCVCLIRLSMPFTLSISLPSHDCFIHCCWGVKYLAVMFCFENWKFSFGDWKISLFLLVFARNVFLPYLQRTFWMFWSFSVSSISLFSVTLLYLSSSCRLLSCCQEFWWFYLQRRSWRHLLLLSRPSLISPGHHTAFWLVFCCALPLLAFIL